MEALLGATRANNSCASVAEVQDQLRNIFGARVSDVAADHINESFKLQSNVAFSVPVTDSENEVLEGAAAVDPQLGGAMSSAAPALGPNGHQTFRKINAIDTLINQPHDDNALQQSVAKHIIASLSEIDRSTWIIRGVARTEQGWTFTYICKSSMQAWQRQTSKTPAKVPIGAYSNKDGLDPVNGRPSFDCRGQLTVAFIKSSRTIEVKYEHTPLHKSVAELLELLAPEPPPLAPLPAAANKKAPKEPRPPKEPKAPKPSKEPRPPKTPRPPRKRQANGEGAGGEGSQPKKRRKKDSLGTGQENTGFPPEMPGALPVGGPDRQYYNNQVPGDSAAGGYPDGLVGSGENEASRSVSQDASVHGGVHSQSILNLPPGEAARRRDVAIQLLTQHGLDAETLSPEQFSIFSNQSPELQKESLEMLVRYGAERLRIVHPNEKEGSAASQTPTPEQNSHVENQTNQSQTPSGTKPTKLRRKKSDAATAQQQGEGGGTKKVKYTRGTCELCRVSKDKCDKQKPMCSQCLAAGLQCEYALAKSRPSRGPKEVREDSEAAEQPHESPHVEPEQPEPMEAVQQHAEDIEPEQPEAEEEPDDLGSPGFRHHEPAELPQSELVPPSMEPSTYTQSTGIYQQHPSGLTFPAAPQPAVHEVSHQPSMASAAMDYLSAASSTAETTMPNFTYPPPASATQLTFPEHPEPVAQHVTQHATATHQRTGSRRALPMSQPTQSHIMNGSGTESHVNSWTAVSNSPVIAAAAMNKPSPRLSKAQQPAAHSAPRAYDDARQSSSWSATAQPTGQTTTTPAYQSPRQVAAQTARAKSRQANRPQTRIPVPTSPPPARAAQVQSNQAAAKAPSHTLNTGASNSASVASYDYNQYSTSHAESSNSRVAYEPYSNHPATAASNSYSGYEAHNPRQASSTASAGLAHPASQTVASSYNATTVTAPSSSQWGTTATNSQSRNTQSYSASQPASGTAYGGQQQQSQNLEGFSVRPQPPAQVRATSSTYGQHAQQPQQQPQQRQQPPQQPHQQHQKSYSGYSNQQHNNNAPQQQQQQQQQSWYGFNAANNPNSAYNSTAASGNSAYTSAASHTHGNTGGGATYNQPHHRSMNPSGHTYSSIDGDQALYDLLRNNQSG